MRRIARLAAAVLVVVACGASLTKEKYDRVEAGMSLERVQRILGPGTKVDSAGVGIGKLSIETAEYRWEGGGKSVTVNFVNGKATTKSQKGL